MSFLDRFTNLFTSPSAAFEGLSDTPMPTGQVMIVLLISVVITAVMSFWLMSQPDIQEQIMDQQIAGIEKKMESGEISADQGQQIIQQMEAMSNSSVGLIIGTVSATIGTLIFFFLIALYLMVLGKFLGEIENYTYSIAMSVTAVTFMFGWIQSLLVTSVKVLTGNLYGGIGPVMAFEKAESTTAIYKVMAALDITMLIYLALLVIGFRVTSKAGWVASVLVIAIPYTILTGIGMLMQ